MFAWIIDDTDGGEELMSRHGEKIGQFCLGVHAVAYLLDLFHVFLCLSLMYLDWRLRQLIFSLLLTNLLNVVTNLLLGRYFQKMTGFLIEFVSWFLLFHNE